MEKKQIQFISYDPKDLIKELKESIHADVISILKENWNPSKVEDEEILLTIEQTTKMLSINASSLWRYTKEGTFKSYSLPNSSRKYYKKSEILASFKPVKV